MKPGKKNNEKPLEETLEFLREHIEEQSALGKHFNVGGYNCFIEEVKDIIKAFTVNPKIADSEKEFREKVTNDVIADIEKLTKDERRKFGYKTLKSGKIVSSKNLSEIKKEIAVLKKTIEELHLGSQELLIENGIEPQKILDACKSILKKKKQPGTKTEQQKRNYVQQLTQLYRAYIKESESDKWQVVNTYSKSGFFKYIGVCSEYTTDEHGYGGYLGDTDEAIRNWLRKERLREQRTLKIQKLIEKFGVPRLVRRGIVGDEDS